MILGEPRRLTSESKCEMEFVLSFENSALLIWSKT
jgi:hypothetical protein